MLAQLIKEGFGVAEDLNCAEKILRGANKAYNLGLDREALKLASGFGGGMGIESTCGAVAAAIMVLGKLFVQERAHESTRLKELCREFLGRYEEEMSGLVCAPLKAKYRTEQQGCFVVIHQAAQILDDIVSRELELLQ